MQDNSEIWFKSMCVNLSESFGVRDEDPIWSETEDGMIYYKKSLSEDYSFQFSILKGNIEKIAYLNLHDRMGYVLIRYTWKPEIDFSDLKKQNILKYLDNEDPKVIVEYYIEGRNLLIELVRHSTIQKIKNNLKQKFYI